MKLSVTNIKEFASYLRREEKSEATQEKYLRDVQSFCVYADGSEITKELVVEWKKNPGGTGICSAVCQFYVSQHQQLFGLCWPVLL